MTIDLVPQTGLPFVAGEPRSEEEQRTPPRLSTERGSMYKGPDTQRGRSVSDMR
jgi:hypothetical protein